MEKDDAVAEKAEETAEYVPPWKKVSEDLVSALDWDNGEATIPGSDVRLKLLDSGEVKKIMTLIFMILVCVRQPIILRRQTTISRRTRKAYSECNREGSLVSLVSLNQKKEQKKTDVWY